MSMLPLPRIVLKLIILIIYLCVSVYANNRQLSNIISPQLQSPTSPSSACKIKSLFSALCVFYATGFTLLLRRLPVYTNSTLGTSKKDALIWNSPSARTWRYVSWLEPPWIRRRHAPGGVVVLMNQLVAPRTLLPLACGSRVFKAAF